MRIVVLGSGTIARLRASALVADGRVSWLGIAGSRSGWAQEAVTKTGASAAGTMVEMLAASPDAIVIASATSSHADHIRACLPLHVPLFCEKPIASTLEDAVRLVAETESVGVALQVGFDRRFDPALVPLRSAITSGALGALHSITLTSHDRDPPSEAFAAVCGGMFLDLHIHDFDLARWLTGGEVQDVTAVAARRGPSEFLDALGDVDTTALVFRMRDGLPVMARGSRQDPAGYMMRTEVVAAARSVTVTDKHYADYRERFHDALLAKTSAFLDVVAGVRPNPCRGEECIQAMRVAVAAELSNRERRTVFL